MADPEVIIDFEPNWSELPEIGYGFETVIQGTPYFLEQRRPLLPTPARTMNCKYQFSAQDLQRARNILLYGASKLCCVPIYSEPIQAAAFSGSSITATTDLSYLWNIQNCDYIVLLDFVSGQSEMVAVSSVVGQVISLAAAIVNSWTAAQTIAYPAFAGVISGVKGLDVTDQVGQVEVTFDEISNGEEATKEWVGLEDQVCPPDIVPASAACSEYFNGTDGSAYDQELYTVITAGGDDPLIYSNMLRFVGPISTRRYDAVFSFTGAFDIYLDFTREVIDPDESGQVGLILNAYAEGIYFAWGSVWYAEGTGYSASGAAADVEISPILSGKLRLTRDSSGTIRAYYWNASLSQWEWDGDTAGTVVATGSTADITPGLYIQLVNATDQVSIGDIIVAEGCSETTWP